MVRNYLLGDKVFKPNDKVIPLPYKIKDAEKSMEGEIKETTVCTVIDKKPDFEMEGYDFVVIEDEFGYVFNWPTKYLEHSK